MEAASQTRSAPYLRPRGLSKARTVVADYVELTKPRVQTLLGYDIMPPFMGHVTASHPTKALKPDYVNAVLAQRPPG